MSHSPIAIKRQTVLGRLYEQCETIESIPVYLNDASGEVIGYVDESLGRYADTFLFHLPEDVCKKLSMSGFKYGFDFESSDVDKLNSKSRIKLNHILLIAKQKSDVAVGV